MELTDTDGDGVASPWPVLTMAPIVPILMTVATAQGVLRFTRAVQTKFKVVAALRTVTAAAVCSASMVAYRNDSPKELELASKTTVGLTGFYLGLLGLEEGLVASMHMRLGPKGSQVQIHRSKRLAAVYLGLAVLNQSLLLKSVMERREQSLRSAGEA